MQIIQTVTVKQVLTENSKSKLLSNYEWKKQQLQKECDQFKFEMKKWEKAKKAQSNLKTYFDKEIQSRNEKIKLLDFQIEQLHMLPLGSELKEKEVQALVTIEKGDRWDSIENGKTIIIKDGIIDEIR
ncbi:putative RNase H-like nuclease (RuvC/YqgF family) [Cytobacillus horneckiae]|uniref:YlqD family protein n=1 Tax=Cytobacillus horneckiae TaxID=549687 RepID=UPI0019D2BDA4|nr:YlqD family protein [Cytobacillus horneckiae]MBN6887140.1 YlqD family protein [Cytobacillus horneckiae]MCM3178269.1 YlqD family protein [Cytobacillus horneckiae]